MRLEDHRQLTLAQPVAEVWRSIASLEALPTLIPDLEAAVPGRGGGVELCARFGRRRRWWAATSRETGQRSLELVSATPGVEFRAAVSAQEAEEGTSVKVEVVLVPPKRWLHRRRERLGHGPILARLLASSALFAVAVAGFLLAPRWPLPRWGSALLWAVLGAAFLGAAAVLTGAHRRQQVAARVQRAQRWGYSTGRST